MCGRVWLYREVASPSGFQNGGRGSPSPDQHRRDAVFPLHAHSRSESCNPSSAEASCRHLWPCESNRSTLVCVLILGLFTQLKSSGGIQRMGRHLSEVIAETSLDQRVPYAILSLADERGWDEIITNGQHWSRLHLVSGRNDSADASCHCRAGRARPVASSCNRCKNEKGETEANRNGLRH